jgi:hypothetical protein
MDHYLYLYLLELGAIKAAGANEVEIKCAEFSSHHSSSVRIGQ